MNLESCCRDAAVIEKEVIGFYCKEDSVQLLENNGKDISTWTDITIKARRISESSHEL